MSVEKFGRHKTEIEERLETDQNASAKKARRNSRNTREICGGLSEGTGMNTYFYGPMGFAKTLKLRFRAGGPEPA